MVCEENENETVTVRKPLVEGSKDFYDFLYEYYNKEKSLTKGFVVKHDDYDNCCIYYDQEKIEDLNCTYAQTAYNHQYSIGTKKITSE